MAHIYAVGGGKGGCGKSFLTASLGAILAKTGKRVVVVDLDLGGSNLHTLVEPKSTQVGLHTYLSKTIKDLQEAAIPTRVHNLFLIASVGCSLEISNLFAAQKNKIIQAIQRLDADWVILDLGAGSSFNTLDFCLAAHTGLFLFTPEPTSIQNAVQFIKAVYLRKIKQILKQDAFTLLAKEVAAESEDGVLRSPLDMVDYIARRDPDRGREIQEDLNLLMFGLILNQYRKHIDADLGDKVTRVCNRHFYSHFEFLGNISHDDRVHESVLGKQVFMEKYPYSPTATDLKRVVERMESILVPSRTENQKHANV